MPDNQIPNYPSNSFTKKEDDTLNKKRINPQMKVNRVTKVTKGLVTKKKKSFLSSIASNFFGNDTHSVGGYILYDVLIPAAKKTISEMISSGIDMLLYGEPRGSTLINKDRGRPVYNYNKAYVNPHAGEGSRYINRRDDPRNRTLLRFDDIVLDRRADAEEVLDNMVEMISQYGIVTVADFYDLLGFNSEYSDYKFGWDNLSQATIVAVREGYSFNFPKVLVIND